MIHILPVADLSDYKEVLKKCRKGEPVYLTQEGRGRFVLMDIEDYDGSQAGKSRMETSFDPQLVDRYKSKSQIARVLTETWTEQHLYCPLCGWPSLSKFPNNREVADFYCPNCKSQFEQKSKNGPLGKKIAGGAYHSFIRRISENHNPDFFLMSYSLKSMRVEALYFIPKFFFVPEIVEERKPLSEHARRAGWVGCNILLSQIPVQGRIPIIENGVFLEKQGVLAQVKKAQEMRLENVAARSWLLDILQCVNQMEERDFTLDQMYAFENWLGARHPQNHNIRAKIRQQLQKLRDGGVLLFLGDGHYRKIFSPDEPENP